MAQLKKNIPALIILALLPAALWGLSADVQAEPLILDNPGEYAHKSRPAVSFPHDLHQQAVDCLDCHHDYANGSNMLDEADLEADDPAIRCISCHAGNAAVDVKSAYHRQCIGCHRRLRQEGQAAAPELCGECHIRSGDDGK